MSREDIIQHPVIFIMHININLIKSLPLDFFINIHNKINVDNIDFFNFLKI